MKGRDHSNGAGGPSVILPYHQSNAKAMGLHGGGALDGRDGRKASHTRQSDGGERSPLTHDALDAAAEIMKGDRDGSGRTAYWSRPERMRTSP